MAERAHHDAPACKVRVGVMGFSTSPKTVFYDADLADLEWVYENVCAAIKRTTGLRDLIALRTSEGRARARRSGIKFGPKFKLSPHQMEEIRRRKEAGDSCRLLARSYKVSPNTISRVR